MRNLQPLYDNFGLEVNHIDNDALTAIKKSQQLILNLDNNVNTIPNLANQFPHSIYLQCYAAIYYLNNFTKRNLALANSHLQQANRHKESASLRSRALLTACNYWCNYDFINAATTLHNLAIEYPQDLIVTRTYEDIMHYRNKTNFIAEYQGLLSKIKKYHPNSDIYFNMLAHSNLLNNKKAMALKYAEQSLTLNPNNANATNIKAAAQWSQGKHQQALQTLQHSKINFKKLQGIVKTRNMCLEAWINLDSNHINQTFKIISEMISLAHEYTVDEAIYLISLMWQFDIIVTHSHPELENATNKLWLSLAPHIYKFRQECLLPIFNTMLCYAYSRAGDYESTEENLKSINQFIITCRDHNQKHMWQKYGFTSVQSAIAYAEHEYVATIQLIEPIIGHINQIGGDDFIRQPLHTTLIDANKIIDERGYDREELQNHWTNDFRN